MMQVFQMAWTFIGDVMHLNKTASLDAIIKRCILSLVSLVWNMYGRALPWSSRNISIFLSKQNIFIIISGQFLSSPKCIYNTFSVLISKSAPFTSTNASLDIPLRISITGWPLSQGSIRNLNIDTGVSAFYHSHHPCLVLFHEQPTKTLTYLNTAKVAICVVFFEKYFFTLVRVF